MQNVIQYAPAIYAFGAKLNYDTKIGEMDIVEYPARDKAKEILDAALSDIKLFEDTANRDDGASIIALAHTVDGKDNPLTKHARTNILAHIGIMREGKFVKQILERAKVNRSWHISEAPSDCTYFGEICTHRGVYDTSHRRGRKSERNPEEYHLKSSKGIGREQLVTPALEAFYDSIPANMLISESRIKPIQVSVPNFEDMHPEELRILIEKIEGELKSRVKKG